MQSALSILIGYGLLIIGLLFLGTAIVQLTDFAWIKAGVYLLVGVVSLVLGIYLTGTYERWKVAKNAQLQAKKQAQERTRKKDY